MTSGADLFVVCKHCGSEVSPYITECPYCGSRLRRRAPKLPRVHAPTGPVHRRGMSTLLRRVRGRRTSVLASPAGHAGERWVHARPYATITLVLVSCAAWIAAHAEPVLLGKLAIEPEHEPTGAALGGTLHGNWWKLFTNEFAFSQGLEAFVAIGSVAIFGWLLERRHGPLVAGAIFFGGGVTGALVACAVYRYPFVSGGNASALALLAAWAAPDVRALRAGSYYEGDLLGAGLVAALLLALPFAYIGSEVSWLAGVVGAAFGLLVGFGLQLRRELEP